MTATELCRQAAALGLRLEPAGDHLAVTPGRLCPPEFAAVLRQHKRELLDLLETQTVLRPDELPWLHVARQVLAAEFDGADNSTVQSLTIGLRGIQHPLCQQAIGRLGAVRDKPDYLAWAQRWGGVDCNVG
jgi:hypothetical protein